MPKLRWSNRFSKFKAEVGSVTAELAIAMPAVSLVIGITLGAFAMQVDRMKLVDVAATVARSLGRGEPEDVIRELANQMLGSDANISLELSILENLACVTLKKPVTIAGLSPAVFELAETACARKMGL